MAVLGLHWCEEGSQQRFCPRTANTASGGFLLSSKPTSLFIFCLYFSKGNPLSDLLIPCSPPPPPNTHAHTYRHTLVLVQRCKPLPSNGTQLPAVPDPASSFHLGGSLRVCTPQVWPHTGPLSQLGLLCMAVGLGCHCGQCGCPWTLLLGTGPHRGCLPVPESRTCPWLWREQWEPLRRSKHRNSISPNSHGWWGPARFVWQCFFSQGPWACMGFPCGPAGKDSACKAGDPGSIPGSERSSGEGIDYPLQYC